MMWNEFFETCNNLCKAFRDLYDAVSVSLGGLSYRDYVNWILHKKHYGKRRKHRHGTA